jgi:hypothetical protein
MLYWKFNPLAVGGAPICPAATCTFCSRNAPTTSSDVSPRALSLAGSIQIRMPKSLAPKIFTSPTPSSRARTSLIWVVA